MKSLVLVLLVFILFACEKDNFFEGEYSEYVRNQQIETEVEFSPSEIYKTQEGQPSMVLRFSTKQIYPCINYQIVTTVFNEKNELIIRFDEILIGDICLTAIGPASATIMLPEDITKLVLINGEEIDVYDVNISNEKIELKKLISSFSKLEQAKIFRYPENSFVYSCKNNEANVEHYQAFMEIMQNNLSFTEFTFQGEGSIPYAESTDEEVARYFIYEKQEDFELAGELFRQYINSNSVKTDWIYIELTDWKNKKFLSWMMYE